MAATALLLLLLLLLLCWLKQLVYSQERRYRILFCYAFDFVTDTRDWIGSRSRNIHGYAKLVPFRRRQFPAANTIRADWFLLATD